MTFSRGVNELVCFCFWSFTPLLGSAESLPPYRNRNWLNLLCVSIFRKEDSLANWVFSSFPTIFWWTSWSWSRTPGYILNLTLFCFQAGSVTAISRWYFEFSETADFISTDIRTISAAIPAVPSFFAFSPITALPKQTPFLWSRRPTVLDRFKESFI